MGLEDMVDCFEIKYNVAWHNGSHLYGREDKLKHTLKTYSLTLLIMYCNECNKKQFEIAKCKFVCYTKWLNATYGHWRWGFKKQLRNWFY